MYDPHSPLTSRDLSRLHVNPTMPGGYPPAPMGMQPPRRGGLVELLSGAGMGANLANTLGMGSFGVGTIPVAADLGFGASLPAIAAEAGGAGMAAAAPAAAAVPWAIPLAVGGAALAGGK